MLLTITTTRRPATDLAVLLQQDPDRVRLVALPFGSGLLCFSQADEVRCTAAVMVHSEQRSLSLLALALADVFADTLAEAQATDGLRGMPLPIEVDAPLLPCAGDPAQLRRLFEPLGYHVAVSVVPGDPRKAPGPGGAPGSDAGRCDVAVRLTGLVRVPELLAHLCVLLPVLDGDRDAPTPDAAAAAALLAHGRRWVHDHPECNAVLGRFSTAATTA